MAYVNCGVGVSRVGLEGRIESRRRSPVVAVAKKVRRVRNAGDELIGEVGKDGWSLSGNSSRFPVDWNAGMEQAGAAACKAIGKGESRILVELNPPVRHIVMVEKLINPLIQTGKKVKVYFDTIAESAEAASMLPDHLRDRTEFTYLGDREDMGDCDVAVIYQPNNINGNPKKIEDVEWVHYRLEWNEPRPVILVNPKLMSLGSGLDALGNIRRPMFIEDYIHAYYLDPSVFHDENIHGGLLCEYPRKWEMYVFRSNGGFRLVAQHRAKPNAEKVLVQYLWRSDMLKSNSQRMRPDGTPFPVCDSMPTRKHPVVETIGNP